MTRLLALLTVLANVAAAQCVMCLRTASAQQVERARVLNLGIIIMLIPAMLIPAGFLYLLYRRSRTHNGMDET